MNIISKTFLKEIAKEIESLAMQVRNSSPVEQKNSDGFKFSKISTESRFYLESLLDWEKSHGKSSYIYVITALDNADTSGIDKAYGSTKDEKCEDRAYARVNKHESQTLYVGSSHSIKKRISEHLGFGSKRTYALHMKYWAEIIDGKFTISIYRFEDTNSKVLQAIEDGLWDSLNPMFGKQGSR